MVSYSGCIQGMQEGGGVNILPSLLHQTKMVNDPSKAEQLSSNAQSPEDFWKPSEP